MGVTICEIHGRTGSTLISPDIYETFLSDQIPSEKYFQIRAKMFNRVTNFCWLSSNFVERFDISVDETMSFSELPNSGEELLSSLVPVCGKCFKEWLHKTEG